MALSQTNMKTTIAILLLAGICAAQDIQVVTRTNFLSKVTYDAAGKRQVERVPIVQQVPLPLVANNPAELETILNQLATNQVYAASFIQPIGGTNSAPLYQVQLRKR